MPWVTAWAIKYKGCVVTTMPDTGKFEADWLECGFGTDVAACTPVIDKPNKTASTLHKCLVIIAVFSLLFFIIPMLLHSLKQISI